MALIAYLMEFKGNYGPHLIIVPNAVLVNWKSELHTWLPSVSCIYYVGTKDQRSKLFSQVKFEKVSFAPDVLKTLIDTSPVLFNRRFAP
jgi:SNF2 family DNA or RNA helicase